MRTIEKKMVEWLDAKLESNGLAQDAIKKKDARLVFGLAMDSCVGIREKGGNNRGPMVELIQDTVGSADREPWCMSLVQTCVAYAEKKTGIKSSLVASEHCLTVWRESPKSLRVKSVPAPDAIIIWRHGTSSSGHTGKMRVWRKNKMDTVEGNSVSGVNPSGAVVADGGGVYANVRSVTGSGNMKVVGFLKPF